jgi:hypothetical protein
VRVVCDAGALPPDAVSVDALARLALEARRHGCRVELRNVPAELGRLLAFLGLDRAVGVSGGFEPQGEAEEREQPLGVEERVDRGDLPV